VIIQDTCRSRVLVVALRGHNPPRHQRYGRTDGQTDRRHARSISATTAACRAIMNFFCEPCTDFEARCCDIWVASLTRSA